MRSAWGEVRIQMGPPGGRRALGRVFHPSGWNANSHVHFALVGSTRAHDKHNQHVFTHMAQTKQEAS